LRRAHGGRGLGTYIVVLAALLLPPMRSLGPALVSGNPHALWLYILAPLLGTSLGALTYQLIRDETTAV